jgi:predicted dehydrogenase
MADKIIKWGILAPGKIARKFATELAELKNGVVYAVGSTNLDRAQEFASTFGAKRYYNSYEALVADPEVDIVYVASPHAFHAEHTLLCLNHQKPVLCEKALALNLNEVVQMVDTARKNNLFFMEAMMVPHQPSYQHAKHIIESNELGKINFIQSWYGFNKSPYDPMGRLMNPALGGGALLDIGLYPLFDIQYFLGEPHRLTATAEFAPTGVDQSVSVRLEFPNGISASIFASFVTSAGLGTDIFCEFGTIRLRRLSSLDQWMEVETLQEGVKRHTYKEGKCGLKLEALEAMRCLESNRIESELMPLQASITLMKTLDQIRQQCGIKYQERD